MDELYKKLKTFGTVKLKELLSKHTTFKIGGPADYFVTVDSIDNVVALLSYLDGEGVSFMVLGGGSNMLVNDEGYRGVVVRVRSQKSEVEENIIEADAGCVTVDIARESVKAGLTGFEWGVGVPGTIGGAVRGNAGAMGGEMKNVVTSVEVYQDGERRTYTNAECEFGYRESMFKRIPAYILRVTLQLTPGNGQEGMKQALSYLQYRNKTQPQGFASTGCIFKNADITNSEQGTVNKERLLKYFDEKDEKIQQFLKVGKISAGWLVEQVGMKGKKVGNAEVSERHGNFIVNLGGATAADVLALVEEIKEKVYDRYEIEMEEEIQVVG